LAEERAVNAAVDPVPPGGARFEGPPPQGGVRELGGLDAQSPFGPFVPARQGGEVLVRPESPYVVGQKVKVCSGALDGLVATIVEMSEKDRLVVLMDLLNRPVRVKLEANSVVRL
jgi:hypothetical protein